MPYFSIIVPVYNVEDYLPACMESLLAQDTEEAYEILLIDDGSTDSSGALCDQYALNDPRIRVFHRENGGASSARNAGLRAALGEYILFVDSDDLVVPEYLSTFRMLLDTAPDVAICASRRFWENGDQDLDHLPLLPEGENGETYLARLFAARKTPRAYVCANAYRREFLETHSLFFREDLIVSEDLDFNLRCLPLAREVRAVDLPLYRYRMRESSLSNTVSVRKLLCDLQVKAAAYRRFPTAAMANYFATASLNVGMLREVGEEVSALFESNRDIFRQVTHPALKVYRLLLSCLGPWRAARVYLRLRGIRDGLRNAGA